MLHLTSPLSVSVPNANIHMMVASGLRGAVALVLSVNFPSVYHDQLAALTLFINFFTNVFLGGITSSLIDYLQVHIRIAAPAVSGSNSWLH